MFETLFVHLPSIERYRAAPLVEERIRYLQHCRDLGFRRARLKKLAVNQLRLIGLLDLKGRQTVTPSQLEAAASAWSPTGVLLSHFGGSPAHKAQFVCHCAGWLRYLGWFEEPTEPPRHPHEAEVAAYAEWARMEQGYSAATIEACSDVAHEFLAFLASAKPDASLASVRITDVERAIAEKVAPRNLSRATIANYAQRLRHVFRFLEHRGWCMQGIAAAIKAPRIYKHEQLPARLRRAQALRILETTEGDRPADIRDRAILQLLIVYALRSGEVRHLRLDDLDWKNRTLRVQRSKSHRPQFYPLSAGVADAILRYVREVRPSGAGPFVFYTIVSPFRPLTRAALGAVVRNRIRRLGIVAERSGPHALRHATAQHLLDQGMSFKTIGDHLGHVSPTSTFVYAKVDLRSLRKVADFDLVGVL